MKIGITGDLHGNIEAWQNILNNIFNDAEKILVAGDMFGAGLVDRFAPWFQPQKLKKQMAHSPLPTMCVKGNCDREPGYPENCTGEIFGKTYFMCHGENCSSDEIIFSTSQKNQAGIFIYGHTHQWRLEKKGGIIIINPGSPTIPNKENHLTVATMSEKEISIIDIHSKKILAQLENK